MPKQAAQVLIRSFAILFLMFNILSGLFGQKVKGPELSELISQGAFLVDVRTPGEFSQGSVSGAVNIPLDQLAQRLKEFEGKEQIIVFCRSGARSGQAEGYLKQQGLNVVNGGTWQNVKKAKNAK